MRKRSNSMAENETRCSSFLYDKLLLSAAVNFFISQFIRNDANTILGCVRSGRFGQLRIGRHQNIHTLLGHAYVRHIFCHQHRCAAEFTHCHDESFISIDFREFEHRTILCPTSSQAIVMQYSSFRDRWYSDTVRIHVKRKYMNQSFMRPLPGKSRTSCRLSLSLSCCAHFLSLIFFFASSPI